MGLEDPRGERTKRSIVRHPGELVTQCLEAFDSKTISICICFMYLSSNGDLMPSYLISDLATLAKEIAVARLDGFLASQNTQTLRREKHVLLENSCTDDANWPGELRIWHINNTPVDLSACATISNFLLLRVQWSVSWSGISLRNGFSQTNKSCNHPHLKWSLQKNKEKGNAKTLGNYQFRPGGEFKYVIWIPSSDSGCTLQDLR